MFLCEWLPCVCVHEWVNGAFESKSGSKLAKIASKLDTLAAATCTQTQGNHSQRNIVNLHVHS